MDRQLGRILEALEKTGQAENTCIIITGDHGLAVGEHGLMGKQNLYDCSVRMPFIMVGPGISLGRRIDSLMYQHCTFPHSVRFGGSCHAGHRPIPQPARAVARGAGVDV